MKYIKTEDEGVSDKLLSSEDGKMDDGSVSAVEVTAAPLCVMLP